MQPHVAQTYNIGQRMCNSKCHPFIKRFGWLLAPRLITNLLQKWSVVHHQKDTTTQFVKTKKHELAYFAISLFRLAAEKRDNCSDGCVTKATLRSK